MPLYTKRLLADDGDARRVGARELTESGDREGHVLVRDERGVFGLCKGTCSESRRARRGYDSPSDLAECGEM
jgi:hypothetical protein